MWAWSSRATAFMSFHLRWGQLFSGVYAFSVPLSCTHTPIRNPNKCIMRPDFSGHSLLYQLSAVNRQLLTTLQRTAPITSIPPLTMHSLHSASPLQLPPSANNTVGWRQSLNTRTPGGHSRCSASNTQPTCGDNMVYHNLIDLHFQISMKPVVMNIFISNVSKTLENGHSYLVSWKLSHKSHNLSLASSMSSSWIYAF